MARVLPPVPLLDEKKFPPAFKMWLNQIANIIAGTIEGIIAWGSINFTGSNITDIATRQHNDLQAMQGGVGNERYHLSVSQYSSINSYVSVSTNTILTNLSGVVLGDSTIGSINITLPSANVAKRLHIKKISIDANTVDVLRAGSDTIEGVTNIPLILQYSSITIYTPGSGVWYIEAQT